MAGEFYTGKVGAKVRALPPLNQNAIQGWGTHRVGEGKIVNAEWMGPPAGLRSWRRGGPERLLHHGYRSPPGPESRPDPPKIPMAPNSKNPTTANTSKCHG